MNTLPANDAAEASRCPPYSATNGRQSTASAISLHQVTKSYGKIRALDGQLVTINRTDRPVFGSGPTLGSSTPLGGGQQPLGSSALFSGSPRRTQRGSRHFTRRTRQGAGVVFSGLVLGALAFINLPAGDKDDAPVAPRPAGPPNNTVLPASTGTSAPPEATPSTEAPVTASSSLPAPGAPVPTTP